MIKVCLVDMPFDGLKSPVLGLSLLKAAACRDGLEARILYGNIEFTKVIGKANYQFLEVLAHTQMQFVENVFEPYVGYGKIPSRQEVVDYYISRSPQTEDSFRGYLKLMEQFEPQLPVYLDNLCKKILADKPDILGCTYTFSQCNANLALMKRLKELAPEIITIMGGCAISITAGQALVDHMDQLDYVFVGESDDIFSEALTLMSEGKTDELHARFPMVAYRGGTSATHAVCDMNNIAYPDFDEYFEAIQEAGLTEGGSPVLLPVEASRGCWWGCIGRCRFCGLHLDQDVLQYRKKNAERFADELAYLSERYHVQNFYMTDCILDRNHIHEFPKLLSNRGYTIFAEVKTNMTKEEIHGLRIAGFRTLQPGIESLNDQMLQLMNKGNRAIKHVQFLKNARAENMTLLWNMLLLIPGEKEGWFYEDMKMYPLLFHLEAPNPNFHSFQRESIFTQTAKESYGITLRPYEPYKYLFGKELAEDSRYHEYFETVEPLPNSYTASVTSLIREWQRAFQGGCSLFYRVQFGFLTVCDTRPCAVQKDYVFVGPEKDICLLADQTVKIDEVYEGCQEYPRERVAEAMQELINLKLLLMMGNEVIFLAVPGNSSTTIYAESNEAQEH